MRLTMETYLVRARLAPRRHLKEVSRAMERLRRGAQACGRAARATGISVEQLLRTFNGGTR